MKHSTRRLTLERRRAVSGYLFTLPFTIGFLVLFLVPFIQSIAFSLSELRITSTGYQLDYLGLKNFHDAILVQPDFNKKLIEELGKMLRQVPLVIVFSFFAAVMLNEEFPGRSVARTIFFLPVIMSSGVVFFMEKTDYILQTVAAGTQAAVAEGLVGGSAIRAFLWQLKLPEWFMSYIVSAVDNIPVVIRSSGIQILIFLAGLQSIPGSLYEAADVEGCTRWERFWLITFPMLSPLVMTNLVYTIIDFLTGRQSEFLSWIQDFTFWASYGMGTAMALLYFLAVGIIVAIVVSIVSKWVFYQE
ncbi:MAG TPA: sugar ABC transporter permease [Bacillota bacterium]|nr:sugar ABC transporter permease [Bacillota bacterium]